MDNWTILCNIDIAILYLIECSNIVYCIQNAVDILLLEAQRHVD